MKNPILGSVAVAALSLSGMAMAAQPAQSAGTTSASSVSQATVFAPRISRATRRYCNHHNTFKVHSYKEYFKVPIDTYPDPIKTLMRIGFHTAYYICRPPGERRVVRTVNTGFCVKHVGSLPTLVFRAVKADVVVRNSSKTLNEVDNIYLDMHAPVFPGNQYCEARWFIAKTWVPLASLVRARANYWVVLDTWHDQHHETPAMFLDPRNDPTPNIGAGRVPPILRRR